MTQPGWAATEPIGCPSADCRPYNRLEQIDTSYSFNEATNEVAEGTEHPDRVPRGDAHTSWPPALSSAGPAGTIMTQLRTFTSSQARRRCYLLCRCPGLPPLFPDPWLQRCGVDWLEDRKE